MLQAGLKAAALHPGIRRANAEDYSQRTCTQLCEGKQHNGYKVQCPLGSCTTRQPARLHLLPTESNPAPASATPHAGACNKRSCISVHHCAPGNRAQPFEHYAGPLNMLSRSLRSPVKAPHY